MVDEKAIRFLTHGTLIWCRRKCVRIHYPDGRELFFLPNTDANLFSMIETLQ